MMFAEAWSAIPAGDLVGYLLGGGGLALVGRVALALPATLQAYVRSTEARTRSLEATTATARIGAHLAPLVAEGLRVYINTHGGHAPPTEDDSDEMLLREVRRRKLIPDLEADAPRPRPRQRPRERSWWRPKA